MEYKVKLQKKTTKDIEMKVISNGDRNKVYRVKCPYCSTIIQAEEWEFHHFEGMYDEPLVEPNHACPNCNRYFSMLKWDFEKCYIGDGLYPDEKKNILYADGEVIKTNVSTTQKHEGLLTKIKNWFK